MKRSWFILLLVILIACQPAIVVSSPTSILTSTVAPNLETLVHYELRQPQPDDLLKLIDSVLSIEEGMTYDNDVTTAILEREPGSLHSLIGNDFERYYSDGFPSADNFVTQVTLPWEMQSFGDLGSFSAVLRIALLQYINNHQELLEGNKTLNLPNAIIKTLSTDLDGDGQLEWLVDATYEDISLQDWFTIHQREDERYHLLPSEINYDQIPIMDRDTEIAITDLTGDGNPEIIKVEYYYFAGSGSGIIKVYTWDIDRLSLLKSIRLPGVPPIYGEIHASDYAIDDFNGDGLAEIRVNFPRFRRFGCQWTQSSIYYLDGRNPDVEITGEEIPQTDECLIARALESENAVEHIQLYQEAIRKFAPKDLSIDKSAWIKLHLTMAYLATGDDVRANSQLKDLINMEGEGKFLRFIKDKYAETNSPAPLFFCDVLYSSVTSQEIPESIGSEIDADLTHGAYPIDFAPIAELVCPFPGVLRARLDNLKIPISTSPIDAMVAQGYSFVWSQSLDWDNDSIQEWLGILQFEQPTLVFIDGDDDWEIKTIEISLPNLSKVDSTAYTPADGIESKILVLLSGVGKYCNSPDTVKWLISINPESVEYEDWYSCDSNTYSLASEDGIQFALQEFSTPNYFESFDAPDWYYLPDSGENEYERRTILHLASELENDVVEQVDADKTASRISELIVSLPKDNPAAQILLSHLYYLQGLNYELSGQNELAVETYLDLIEFSPQSVWSQFAQIRIQPVKP